MNNSCSFPGSTVRGKRVEAEAAGQRAGTEASLTERTGLNQRSRFPAASTGLRSLQCSSFIPNPVSKTTEKCPQSQAADVTQPPCIINVSEARSSCPPGVDEYVHIPVSDSPLSNLRDHFDWVADKVRVTAENGGRTLVHCNAGVSRSAALCMAFLMRHRGATLLDAHAWLKSCRPIIRPNHGFWRQLIVYETELRGCSSVRMVPSPIGEIPDIYEEEVRNITPLL